MNLILRSVRAIRVPVAIGIFMIPLIGSADYSLTIVEPPTQKDPLVRGPSIAVMKEGLTKSGLVAINGIYTGSVDATKAGFWTQPGGFQTIGTLGGVYSNANDINERGQLVGRSLTSDLHRHAFMWSPTRGMLSLGTLGTSSEAYAINELGQVVGITNDADGISRAFSWTSDTGMTGIDLLGAQFGYAVDVDDDGRVIGLLSYNDRRDNHIFSWSADTGILDLGAIGGEFAVFRDSTDAGHVIGHTRFADGVYRAFLFTPDGTTADLGTLGGNFSTANDVNMSGQVVGYSRTENGGTRAFSWTSVDGLLDLGTLGGDQSNARAINDAGQVVGVSIDASAQPRAFVWNSDSGMIDLNSVLPENGPEGLRLEVATEVGDNGSIVAYGSLPESARKIWVLLSPIALVQDSDSDSIADIDDICPGTRLGVRPSLGATRNRFYANHDGLFVDGDGVESSVTLADTAGCSGQQIIALTGLAISNERYGVWEIALIDWANSLTVIKDIDSDGDGVLDTIDMCPGTVLGIVPKKGATRNRFYATLEGTFVDGREQISTVSVADAGGCSGQQIIAMAGLSRSNENYGIWERYLLDWEFFVNGNEPNKR